MNAEQLVQHYRSPRESDPIRCCYGSEKALMAELWRDAKALQAIRRAPTLETLKTAFQGPAKAARASGDTELLGWLTAAKNTRKAELEAI